MKDCRLRLVLGIALLLLTAAARGAEPIDFYLLRGDSNLSVLLDLSTVLSAGRVSRMQEGIDLVLDYQLALTRPRRVWGSTTVARTEGIMTIGYRIVTGDYHLATPEMGGTEDRQFGSLAKLHRFLADSIVVELATSAEPDSLARYVLKVKLTCISLTDFNLAPGDSTGTSADSPVRYLFRQFLSLTGYGRQEYSTQSRPFALSELPRK
jgi:hypothetical protein